MNRNNYKLFHMKKLSILSLALAAGCLLACSGNNVKYDITGANAPQDGAVVYLMDRITEEPIDSAIVADGAFALKGTAPKDALLSVEIDGWKWYFPLFNDGKPVRISVADTTVTGSALNVKLTECDKQDNVAITEYNNFIEAFLALPEKEQQAREAEFIEQYQQELGKYTDHVMNMIEENRDNLIPVVFLRHIPSLAGKEKFDEFVSSDAPFATHPYTLELKRRLDASSAKQEEAEDAKQAVIGQKFLDLEEADPDGKMRKLSEFVGRGQWVLVDFWASWCGPCKAEMPNVVAAYKQYHGKGFEIVGVSFDQEKEPWVKAIAEWEMPWIHISDLKYWNNAAHEVYSVNSIPDNLLIDPDGIIVARGLRGDKLAARLAEIYK